MWLCGIRKGIEGHREEWMWLWSNGRSAEKETRQWLWSIEKGVEMGRRQWECGYVASGRV